MTCSARSFSLRFSSSASRTSSSLLRPRGRVPAIGCVSTRRPSTRTSISGDEPTIASLPRRMKYMYGDGFTWRSARYTMNGSALTSASKRCDNTTW